MNKIVVRHSSIVINDYDLGDCKKIEDTFSIWDKTYHQSFPKSIEYIQETRQLILPRGIDIPYLETAFGCNAYIDKKHDPMDRVDDIMIKYPPRNDEQIEALDFMIGVSEKYKYNEWKSQLSLNLPTGKGKTYCSVTTISYKRLRSIIMTSSVNWLNQWKDCIIEYTDIKPREIFMLVGTPSILSLLNKDMSQYKVILASLDTIKSYGDKFGWNAVSQLFQYIRVGMKFYDECHLNFDTMAKIDFYTNTYKTYYITATPARSDKDENRIYQLYFKNVPSIDLFNVHVDPHTHYVAIRYDSDPTPQEKSDCRNQYGLDRNKYTSEYITTKPNYYKMIRVVLNLALKNQGKCLIFISTNNAIDRTKLWIEQNYPELIGNIGVYNSTVSGNKEEQLEKKIILSTTKSCGAALDIKDLKMTVVLAEPFKSEVLAIQTLGRTRNADTYYIEIVDVGFNQILKYYYEKKPIFEKYALDCKEIVFKQQLLDMKVEQIMEERYNRLFPVFDNGHRKAMVRVG